MPAAISSCAHDTHSDGRLEVRREVDAADGENGDEERRDHGAHEIIKPVPQRIGNAVHRIHHRVAQRQPFDIAGEQQKNRHQNNAEPEPWVSERDEDTLRPGLHNIGRKPFHMGLCRGCKSKSQRCEQEQRD